MRRSCVPHFQFLEKFYIFSLVLPKISALKTHIFQIFIPKTPHFSRKICFRQCRPYFWKPMWHTPTKKKVECPPPSYGGELLHLWIFLLLSLPGNFVIKACVAFLMQVFFSKFLMGGTQNFQSPSVPDGDKVGWRGTCEKNPTEAKTAHLMQT